LLVVVFRKDFIGEVASPRCQRESFVVVGRNEIVGLGGYLACTLQQPDATTTDSYDEYRNKASTERLMPPQVAMERASGEKRGVRT
jgi:hypothetical protein